MPGDLGQGSFPQIQHQLYHLHPLCHPFGTGVVDDEFFGGTAVGQVEYPGDQSFHLAAADCCRKQCPDGMFLRSAVVVGHPLAESYQFFRDMCPPGGKTGQKLEFPGIDSR